MVVTRAGERRAAHAAAATAIEELTPPLPGQRADVSMHALGPGRGHRRRRTTRRCTSRAAARRRSCSSGPARRWSIDGERHELGAGDSVTFDADLPHHFDEPRRRAGPVPGRRRRRAAEGLMAWRETMFDKIWERPRGRRRPDLHRPAPGPRGHLPAGVRRPAARGPRGAPPGPHAGDRRPQRPDRRHHGRRG